MSTKSRNLDFVDSSPHTQQRITEPSIGTSLTLSCYPLQLERHAKLTKPT